MIVSSKDYGARAAGTTSPFAFYIGGRGIGFGPNGTMMATSVYWSAYTEFGVYLSKDLGKSWLKSNVVPKLTTGDDVAGTYTGTYTDPRDGKVYKTVLMPDGKWWSAENLAWAGAGYDYDNNPANRETYGRLYTWAEAMASCPAGTYLPTDLEWTEMETACGTPETLGTRLKATSGWANGGNGTDAYGFRALPGGTRSYGGTFSGIANYGIWWSATEYSESDAWFLRVGYNTPSVDRINDDKTNAFSVRFIVDSGNVPDKAQPSTLGGIAYGKVTSTQWGWAVTSPGYGIAYFIDTPENYDSNGFPKPEAWVAATNQASNVPFVDLVYDAPSGYWYTTPATSVFYRRQGFDTGSWALVDPGAGGVLGGQAITPQGACVVMERDTGTVFYTPYVHDATQTWTPVPNVLDTFAPLEQWGSVAYADGLWIFVGYNDGTTVYCTDPTNPATYKQAWGPGTNPGLYTVATNGTKWLATNGQSGTPAIIEITVDTRDNAVIGSLPPGTYQGVQMVVLRPIFGNEVRYTTDGSDPTASSTLYTGPLRISASTVIKAVAFYDGQMSPITILPYIVTGADIEPINYKESIMPLLIHQYQKDLV